MSATAARAKRGEFVETGFSPPTFCGETAEARNYGSVFYDFSYRHYGIRGYGVAQYRQNFRS